MKISALNISAIASVATARLVPRVRIAGSATTTPTIVVPTTAATQRGLERPPVGRHEPRRHPRAEPGQRELAQRQLPGVAGDDDDRAQDDRDRERRDERVGPRVHADEQRDRHDDTDHERQERHPSAAGQRQTRERLASLQARPAGHDQEHEDDRERHGLRQAR